MNGRKGLFYMFRLINNEFNNVNNKLTNVNNEIVGINNEIVGINNKIGSLDDRFNLKFTTTYKFLPGIIKNGDTCTINYIENTKYIINQIVYVEDGGKLIINKGVTIYVDTLIDSPLYIAVKIGGIINILGSKKSPVILTSQSNIPGGWGGLIICGSGLVYRNQDGLRITNNLTGHDSVLTYGGTYDFSLSCNISYLIIENAGLEFNNKKFAALSLYSLGYDSMISDVVIVNSGWKGIEIRGGLFNLRRIYIKDCVINAIDISEGFCGKILQTVIYNNFSGFESAIKINTNNISDRHIIIPNQNNDIEFYNLTCISNVGQNAILTEINTKVYFSGITLLGYTYSFYYLVKENNINNLYKIINFLTHSPEENFEGIQIPPDIIIAVNPNQITQFPNLPDPTLINDFASHQFINVIPSDSQVGIWARNHFS
tara:strand:- start:5089 stop:6375 length:1287 start_codon:yes stop_codon:yes gene_type:complete